MSRPAWLPDAFSITGDWDQDLTNLYKIFEADFKHRPCLFKGLRVFFDNRTLEDTYEEGFWHLITQTNQKTKERLFDPRRAECLPWCRSILSNCDEEDVTVWKWREANGVLRTYVWMEEWDYVIILELQRNRRTYRLVTAYHVDGESTRKRLEAKYEGREE